MRLRRRALFLVGAVLVGHMATAQTLAQVQVSDRALLFVLNLHTGVTMRSHEWITPEMDKAPAFKAFGGLAAMVRDTTRFAHLYGGLASLHAEPVQVINGIHRVNIRVTFKDDERRRTSPSMGEREDIVARLTATQVRGVWLFTIE